MKIKKRLWISAAISVSLALIVFIVFFSALYRIDRASKLAMISGDLITFSLERLTLRNDYIRNDNARAREQWSAKHRQIGQMLAMAPAVFPDLGDRRDIDEIVKNHESIGKIFMAIVANREKKSKPAELSQEVEERLISQ